MNHGILVNSAYWNSKPLATKHGSQKIKANSNSMLIQPSEITIQYDTSDEYRDILEGFLEGMKGRLEALLRKQPKNEITFQQRNSYSEPR